MRYATIMLVLCFSFFLQMRVVSAETMIQMVKCPEFSLQDTDAGSRVILRFEGSCPRIDHLVSVVAEIGRHVKRLPLSGDLQVSFELRKEYIRIHLADPAQFVVYGAGKNFSEALLEFVRMLEQVKQREENFLATTR